MNYRMVICDDEKMLLQLIRQLGHFEELGIEIVAECYDGESALEKIRELKPDFVLSDIQMPGMDGLQLIEKAREEDEDILFILLSGYRYFEYARTAIQLNVVDYLLKPVEETQLNNVLEKVCRLVDEKKKSRSERSSFEALRNEEEKRLMDSFWKQVSGSDNAVDHLTRKALEQQYHLIFPYEKFQICMIVSTLGGNEFAYAEKESEFINQIFAEIAFCKIYLETGSQALLLNFAAENTEKIKQGINALFYAIRDLSEIFGSFRLTIGISRIYSDSTALHKAYNEALIGAAGKMVLYGSQCIRYEQVMNLKRFDPEEILSETEADSIRDSLRYSLREELANVFAAMAKRAEKHEGDNPQDMIEVVLKICESLQKSVSEETADCLRKAIIEAGIKADSYRSYLQGIYKVLDGYIQEQLKNAANRRTKPVEDTIQFIHRHYGEQISLEDAALSAGVSSSYLSRVFKEKTGTGFSEYLSQVRIEEAQKLLADSRLSVKEIAAAVGYGDEKYFSRTFKKMTGIKPTDYRKLYG